MKKGILVTGSLNMDLVVHVARHPQPGETLLAQWFATFPGGKGANQAAAAGRLGGNVAMIGRVGPDGFGETLLNNLRSAGVRTEYTLVDNDATTGVALIAVDDRGQNTIVVAAGANGRVSPEDLDKAEPIFAGASVMLIQLEIPMAAVEASARMSRDHGLRVVLNPAPAAPLAPDLVALVDYLTPNQHELKVMTGTGDLEEGVRILHGWGAKNVIVTLGGDGLYYSGTEGAFHRPAFQVEVVDTTAAGDAFMGGFGYALAEGYSLEESLRWGTAAGGLAATRAGAQTSLPTREEVERLLKK